MALFEWKGGSGNLALAANWINEDHPTDPVAPGASDGVLILATGTLTGSLDVESETISGNLTLAGQMTATGGAGISSGTLTVSGTAAALIAADLTISGNVAGSLTVSNNARVALASYLELGTENGSSGALTINSAGTVTTPVVFVGGQSGSPGSISISGAGSTLSADGPVSIGGEGKGSLSIGLGGVFSDIDPLDEVSIASIGGVTGAVSISGKGSTLTDAGRFSVGRAGTGSLSIADGGWLAITSAYGSNFQQGIDVAAEDDASGAITVAGAGSAITDVGFFDIGYVGTGSLAVTTGAAVTVSNQSGIEVGQQTGASGSLTVSTGGKVFTTTSGVTVGNSADAIGSVTVTGVGSTIYSNGYLGFGGPGRGSLTIAAGGKVSDSNSSVGVGAGTEAGGSGTVLVTGVGSKLALVSYVEIGDAGTATMSIAAGGAVSIDAPANSFAAVLAGRVAGGVGAISVNGAGSSLTANTNFAIGYGGKGSLSVSNGASVDEDASGVDTFAVGGLAGSTGAVSVSGAGSKLVSATGFRVGDSGVGAMSVTANAMAAATEYLVFGYAAGARGVGAITGAAVTVGQAGVSGDGVFIGENGVGALTLGAGGVLEDADTASVGAGSILTMAGGWFSSTGLTNQGAIKGFGAIKGAIVNNSKLAVTGGVLLLSGSLTGTGSEAIAADGTLQLVGASLGATGAITGAAGSTLDGYGKVASRIDMAGTVTTGAGITFSGVGNRFSGTLAGGAITFNGGSDTFAGATITAANVNIHGASVTLTGSNALAVAAGGRFTVDGAVSGAGSVAINGGTADFAGTFNENVTFSGTTGTLELARSQSYAGKITGFSLTGGTSLDLADIGFTSGVTKAAYSGSKTSGVLTVTSGAEVAKIHLVGDYKSSIWTLSGDGHGGTTIVDPTNPASTVTPRPTSTVLPFIAAMASFDPGGSDWIGAAETAPSHPLLLAAVRSGR